MSHRLQDLRPATSNEWDLTWQMCQYSTFFHSREWAEVWQAYTAGRMRPHPLLAIFDDGKKALFPLSREQDPLDGSLTFVSSPAGTFGGWVSESDLSSDHAAILTDWLTENTERLVWRLNPYDPLTSQIRVTGVTSDTTQALRLENGFEALVALWTKGHRSAARKATREGITVSLAKNRNEWHAYYEAYQASLRRWGKASSVYDWKLFGTMYERRSRNIRLWLASSQGRIIAGALCFYSKTHVVYWHGAALEDYFHFRPVNLLMHQAIKHACSEGYRWFDFNPSGGHEGVAAFKRSFSPEQLSCPVVRIERSRTPLTRLRRLLGSFRS